MGSARLAEFVLVAAMAVPLTAAAQNTNGRTIYCCDAGGQQMCGDIFPTECYGRAYREISPQGTVRRVVPAPPSAEEIARRDEAVRKRREAEEAALKKRRLDQALLQTYPNVAEIESRRDRAVADLDRTIADLRAREVDLEGRQAAMLKDSESFNGKNLPVEIAENLRNIEAELEVQRAVISAKERERESIRLRFEEDRRRYLELTVPASSPR